MIALKKIEEISLELLSLLPRLVIGIVFVESGWGKFQNLNQVMTYFSSLGIPMSSFQAPFVAGIELIGGLLILSGYKARAASVPLVVVMLVALGTAKYEEIEGISSLLGLVESLYLVLLLVIISRKSDFISLDAWNGRRSRTTLQSLPGMLS